jgi:UDP:flavonoid glycosyltransferase YjiC (YdhE family)
MYEASKRLAAESDLVIGHFCMHPTQLAAEKANMPYVTVTLNHSGLETAYSPPMGFPNLGRLLNKLFWKLGMKLLVSRFKPSINRLRKIEGVLPVRDFRQVWESPLLNLIAVSPVLCEMQPDWPDSYKICGFLGVGEGQEAEAMPDGLDGFIASGEPPVFIGFGSMTVIDPGTDYIPDTVGMMVEAARKAGVRAIIQAPWGTGTLKGLQADESVFRVEKAPHARVYPKCAAIVHHGGAGTTHTAARSGRPSFTVAHLADQIFWGGILYEKGAAPKPIFRRDLTADRLAAKIREMISSQQMAERAAELGRSMQGEDGVTRAVEMISRIS